MRRLATLPALALAGAFALAGCDSSGLDTPGPGPTPGPAPGPAPSPPPGGPGPATFLSLDPQATFLRTNEDPDAARPAVRRLAALGLAPGDEACFAASGDLDLGDGLLASDAGVPLALAIFSSDDALAPADVRERVTGAVGPERHHATPNTVLGDLATDVPQDFDATDACVTVPAGAAYVFLGAWDGYYSDNRRVEPDTYGVRIWRR